MRKLAGTLKPTFLITDNGDGSWTLDRKGGPKEVKYFEELIWLLNLKTLEIQKEEPITFRDNIEFDEKSNIV